MNRPSPQEQAEIDAAGEQRDCRTCGSCRDVDPGRRIRCAETNVTVPWDLATSNQCVDFNRAPESPASPPVSADREGTDVLVTLRRAKTRIGTARELARQHGYPMHTRDMERGLDELDAAISSEEARRADRRLPCGCVRCVCEDPEQCHGCGGREASACQASRLAGGPRHVDAARPAVEDPRNATIRDLRAKLRQWATELDRPAKALEEVSSSERGLGWLHAAGRDAMEATNLRALAAALRAAGVEPTPASPDPAFDGMPCCICGEPLPHEKCGPTPGAAQEGKAGR